MPPGSFAKRFARDLAAYPEDKTLTAKRRETLWRMVVTYRRQAPSRLVEVAQAWLGRPPKQISFEQCLDADPRDWTTRLVYADWLEENGFGELSVAQRWMAAHKEAPRVETVPGCNYKWNWGVDVWCRFGVWSRFSMSSWYGGRAAAEAALANALAGGVSVR